MNTYSETMLEKEGIEWTERLRTLLGGEAEFVYGAEALLIAAVVPPLESILGLDVFHFAAGLPPWSRYVDVSQGNDFIAPDASYSRHHENALSIISRALNLENPSIVIVWGNSD